MRISYVERLMENFWIAIAMYRCPKTGSTQTGDTLRFSQDPIRISENLVSGSIFNPPPDNISYPLYMA
jgi:hypothetical protein